MEACMRTFYVPNQIWRKATKKHFQVDIRRIWDFLISRRQRTHLSSRVVRVVLCRFKWILGGKTFPSHEKSFFICAMASVDSVCALVSANPCSSSTDRRVQKLKKLFAPQQPLSHKRYVVRSFRDGHTNVQFTRNEVNDTLFTCRPMVGWNGRVGRGSRHECNFVWNILRFRGIIIIRNVWLPSVNKQPLLQTTI